MSSSTRINAQRLQRLYVTLTPCGTGFHKIFICVTTVFILYLRSQAFKTKFGKLLSQPLEELVFLPVLSVNSEDTLQPQSNLAHENIYGGGLSVLSISFHVRRSFATACLVISLKASNSGFIHFHGGAKHSNT